MRRENTFRIDFSCFPIKPTYEKVHAFCRQVLNLKKEDVLRLQCHRGEQCAFVKVTDLTLAQKIVDEHDGRHEVDIGGKKSKLRITMEDGSVEVKVHDLPEDVSKEKIIEFLSAFGDVLSLQELMWGESFEFGGIPLGIWSARMLVRQNIDSWVTIDGQQAYIGYKGQLQSCKYCKEQAHSGISCVQNKKLLVQKSYANVTKQTGQRQQKSAGAKSTSATPVSEKATVPSTTTAGEFPELPKPANQTEPSGTVGQAEGASTSAERPASPSRQNQCAHSSSSLRAQSNDTEIPQATVVVADLFKKPASAKRPQSMSGNDYETDDSSTSRSSRRSKRRPPGKKNPRDGGDEEQDEDCTL